MRETLWANTSCISLAILDRFDRLSSAHPWSDLPKTLTSVAIWVVLPAIIGITHAVRREIK